MTKVKAKGYLWKGSTVSNGVTYDVYLVSKERNPDGNSKFRVGFNRSNNGWWITNPYTAGEITGFVELERNYDLKQVDYNHAKGNRIIIETTYSGGLNIADATDDFVPGSTGAEYVFKYSVYDYDTDVYIGEKVIKRIVGETYETSDGQQWVFNGHWSGNGNIPAGSYYYIKKSGGYWAIGQVAT